MLFSELIDESVYYSSPMVWTFFKFKRSLHIIAYDDEYKCLVGFKMGANEFNSSDWAYNAEETGDMKIMEFLEYYGKDNYETIKAIFNMG